MIKCDLVFFDAGGGHRSAADALRTVMERERSTWNVRLINLQEVLDSIDVIQKFTGVRLQDVYNQILKRDWTIAAPQLNYFLRAAIRCFHAQEVKLLEAFWSKEQPDLVVSLVPHFNRAMLEGLRRISRTIPFVTIMTDLADYPPHFWIEPQDQFLICGSDRAVEQSRELGFPQRYVFRTSGMIIHPRFYEPLPLNPGAERRRLGLDPDLPTGLVMFGGQGSPAMLEIAAHLGHSSIEVQLIFLCGHNKKLAEELRKQKYRFPRLILEFTNEVPYCMRIADFFIGKPGPGSLSEALAMRLPVIVERNVRTLPQERYNARWVQEKQVGIVIRSFQSVAKAVNEIIKPEVLSRLQSNASMSKNYALFEIPPLLQGIVEEFRVVKAASA
jgi:1,2-diacylglycerol 3-beta-galactosyltransferase